ncbi:MAG TPA: hypothetical protein VNK04_06150 [Gemmataceae bacterium]|nr:hypothetical protein [Gemmataceae bacterium]
MNPVLAWVLSLNPILAFLLFLVPLAIYFGVLGLINRRQRPLVVSGPWDFAGLLFAVSGFLFFGGPSILAWLNNRWELAQLFNSRRDAAGPGYYFWLGLWVLYFVVVVGGAGLLLWSRRNQLAIYNIEPAVFDEALAQALDRLGLAWSRAGQQVYLGLAPNPSGTDLSQAKGGTGWPGDTAPLRAPPLGSALEATGCAARIELDPSPAMRHVTLSFHQVDTSLRQEIEGELARVLARVYTHSNPVGAWFLLIAALLFNLLFFLALAAVILPVLACS